MNENKVTGGEGAYGTAISRDGTWKKIFSGATA